MAFYAAPKSLIRNLVMTVRRPDALSLVRVASSRYTLDNLIQ